jgi:acetamidase/formamidase
MWRIATFSLLAALYALAQGDPSGSWMVSVYEFGQPNIGRLTLEGSGGKITGAWSNRRVEGSLKGDRIELKADSMTATGLFQGDEMKGDVKMGERVASWNAVRIPRPPSSPRMHDFEPTVFHLYFASSAKPVLRIHPGDTVRTWSVDAGGRDKAGTRRSPGGNPQTGPFFIEGALPGDTLIVRLNKVQLNRDWAGSGSSVMRNALDPWSIADLKWTTDFPSRWKLDRDAGVAALEKPTEKLKNFSVPLAPMLGCVAVAPPGEWGIRTTDSGRFGGNMDYNQIREGTTLYLPVSHPGALLFLGDGHAAQGDGELTGDALETSMDIEFTVDLITGQSFGHPLAENDEYLISIGIAGSLDQALQMATSGMMRWLDRYYKLSASEAAMVVGFTMKYDVADLVGTQVSIAAKLPKKALARLQKAR